MALGCQGVEGYREGVQTQTMTGTEESKQAQKALSVLAEPPMHYHAWHGLLVQNGLFPQRRSASYLVIRLVLQEARQPLGLLTAQPSRTFPEGLRQTHVVTRNPQGDKRSAHSSRLLAAWTLLDYSRESQHHTAQT